jgi:hypothetical protein
LRRPCLIRSGAQAASFKVGAQGAEGQGKDLQFIESDGLAEDLLDAGAACEASHFVGTSKSTRSPADTSRGVR